MQSCQCFIQVSKMPYIFIKNAIILKIIHNIFNLHDTEVVRRMLTTIKDVIFISEGMQTLITVAQCGNSKPVIEISGKVRKYYISAEQVIWNGLNR